MIVSASRRCDIPAFFAPWFFERLKAGYALTANPYNPAQVRRVSLTPDEVDAFVFWSRNPAPLLEGAERLKNYLCLFQQTVTGFDKDLEPGLPPLAFRLSALEHASDIFGAAHVRWRYDPIGLSEKYTLAHHIERFTRLADRLCTRVDGCTISFLDEYAHIKKAIAAAGLRPPDADERLELGIRLSAIAHERNMPLYACAEEALPGVLPAACIDGAWIAHLKGSPVKFTKDTGQRPGCRCAKSVDIGRYSRCAHGCLYCYATKSPEAARRNIAAHDPAAEML